VTLAVLRKELAALWATPVPYVVGAAFHVVLGILVANQLEVRQQAVLQPVFPLAGFLLLLVVPVLAMRTFAEELRTGTLDVLLAVPVSPRPLVVGKWLATWITSIVLTAPAGVVVVLVHLWGSPDRGPAITGFVGLALLAGALAAVGVLASALTSSQPVAAMVAVSAVLVLWFAHVGSDAISTGSTLASISLSERLRTFAGGAIDTADVAYFGCLAVGALALASLAIELRRLR
jgi:ABC-2 type transport system permease protein